MATFLRRILGALSLDRGTFEDVEADRGATLQAAAVVLLAAVGAGVGNAGVDTDQARAVGVAVVISVIAWASWAALTAYLGTRILPGPGTRADVGQLLRTLGFAAAPGMFRGFEILSGTRWLVLPLTSVWMLAAMIVAIRQALDYESTARAVGLAVLGWAVSIAVAAGIGLIFTVPVS